MFIAPTRYVAAHPNALAIYCSDGRFTGAVEDLLRHLGHDRLDTLTLPGGPALLNFWTASILETDQVARAAHFLIRGHDIEHVVLLAHAGCGYYRQRFPGRPVVETRKTQLEDLRAAARTIGGVRRDIDISLYYASPENHRVRFDRVEMLDVNGARGAGEPPRFERA